MLAISIDPRDKPAALAAAKGKYLAGYRHAGGAAGVHFLGGPTDAVKTIADAVGFPYRYDADLDQYVHPAGFVVAAADGTISRYLLGVGANGDELRGALTDAAQRRALGPLTRILLLCHIDGRPIGRWAVPLLAALTAADLLAMAALVAVFVTIRRRREG
jgi:protein SCO1/2